LFTFILNGLKDAANTLYNTNSSNKDYRNYYISY